MLSTEMGKFTVHCTVGSYLVSIKRAKLLKNKPSLMNDLSLGFFFPFKIGKFTVQYSDYGPINNWPITFLFLLEALPNVDSTRYACCNT